jgi:dTDP-4-amino-4,6-dideoxygalactose transaminase
MSPYRIPFNRVTLAGDELRHIADAITQGHIGGDGAFTRRAQDLLQDLLDVPKVLLTTSCTHALEMAALLLHIQPGDEVIVPSFTFVSTPAAFALRGAKPVFVDIRPDTLNIDESKIEDAITEWTRAIVVVHYGGVGCEMDRIARIANRYGLALIEDNAHSLFGKYKDQYLGTFGCLATQSFHETKNITCGEGGALLINDPQYVERAEILREKGTNRARFFRGEVDKYSWVDIGSSYVPSDVLAAFLMGQLEKWQSIQSRRQFIWHYYEERLRGWARAQGVKLPVVPAHCSQAYHMFYLLLPSFRERQAFIDHLKARGILSVFHYLPLHLSEVGFKFGGRPGMCPVTEDVSERLVRLPFYQSLTESELDEVVQASLEFKGRSLARWA